TTTSYLHRPKASRPWTLHHTEVDPIDDVGHVEVEAEAEAEADAVEDMVTSLQLQDEIDDHLCPSLHGTYDNLPRLSRAAIQETCLSPIAINKLRVYLSCVGIRNNSEQERAIVRIVTTPLFGPLIYNPARADWRKFQKHTPAGYNARPFIAHIDNPAEAMCSIIFGGVHKSGVTEEHELGKTGSLAKTAPLSPMCLEWPRGFNFFSHTFDFTYMHVPAWDGSIGFMTRTRKIDEAGSSADRWTTNPFLSTTPKVSKTTQGVRSVDYQTVSGDRTSELLAKLRGIIASHGLACTDKVPVYNMTQHYGAAANVSDIQTPDMFLARMASAPLWDEEIPEKSFVGILGLPTIFDRHRMNDDHRTRVRLIVAWMVLIWSILQYAGSQALASIGMFRVLPSVELGLIEESLSTACETEIGHIQCSAMSPTVLCLLDIAENSIYDVDALCTVSERNPDRLGGGTSMYIWKKAELNVYSDDSDTSLAHERYTLAICAVSCQSMN
ncbi:hypothetical protein BC629DRAFT_1444828, partial [Irpex lacteus]